MNMPANFFAPKPAPVAASAASSVVPKAPNSSLEGAAAAVAASTATAAGVAVQDNATQPAAPLAEFSKLWETDASKTVSTPTGVLPAVTAEQLTKTLANANFLQTISPEVMAKAAGGDAAAFADVINQGLRTVMTQSVLASHGLVEAGARSHGEKLLTSLPTAVRTSNVNETLQKNPLYSNPAIRPIIDNVRGQLETKFPQAAAHEIAAMTDAYFADLSKAFSGNTGSSGSGTGNNGQTQSNDTDWFAVLGLDGR